jgi:hypothetical protein
MRCLRQRLPVLSAVLSNQLLVNTVATIRYFFPALVFGAILVARTLTENKWLAAYYYVALSASLAFTGITYAQRGVAADPGIEALSTWLSNNGLTSGFGPYWSSSIVTALSSNRVKIRALISDGQGKLKPFQFMANKKWYQNGVTDGA